MKAKFTCVIILILLVQFSNAQKISLNGGLNIANIKIYSNDKSSSDADNLYGIHVGPIVEFYLSKNLNLNTGIRYSMNGFRDKSSENENITTKLNYIEVPLNIVLKFTKNDKPIFFIEAGPFLGYAVNGKVKVNDVTVDIDFKEEGLKRLNSGLELAIGKEFGNLAVRICSQAGCTDINDDPDFEAKLKTQVYRLSLAYIF